MIAEMADLPVNIVHLSTKRSLEAVERARQRGQSVYVETCPQYLLLDDHLYDAPNLKQQNMSAHRHYANERINGLCGKGLKRGQSIQYRQITAVLIFTDKKQLAKMILVKFPMGCQVLKRDQN